MPRKLKIWNGRWNAGRQPIHIYACAYSVRDLNELLQELGLERVSQSEIRDYWVRDCWGRSMDGIEPERGIWIERADKYGDDRRPIRVRNKKDQDDLAEIIRKDRERFGVEKQ